MHFKNPYQSCFHCVFGVAQWDKCKLSSLTDVFFTNRTRASNVSRRLQIYQSGLCCIQIGFTVNTM